MPGVEVQPEPTRDALLQSFDRWLADSEASFDRWLADSGAFPATAVEAALEVYVAWGMLQRAVDREGRPC